MTGAVKFDIKLPSSGPLGVAMRRYYEEAMRPACLEDGGGREWVKLG